MFDHSFILRNNIAIFTIFLHCKLVVNFFKDYRIVEDKNLILDQKVKLQSFNAAVDQI